MEKPTQKFFAFGVNVSGTIAIGLNVSGVVAIGLNAAGSLLAIGFVNAIGPIAVAGVNAAGIFSVAGVNAIGAWALGTVMHMGSPLAAAVSSVVWLIVSLVLRGKRRPMPMKPHAPDPPWVPLASVSDQTDVWTRASAAALPDGMIELREGDVVRRVNAGSVRVPTDHHVFVHLRGQRRPLTNETDDYRHVEVAMEHEVTAMLVVTESPSVALRLGLTPWTRWNSYLVAAVILIATMTTFAVR